MRLLKKYGLDQPVTSSLKARLRIFPTARIELSIIIIDKIKAAPYRLDDPTKNMPVGESGELVINDPKTFNAL